MENSRSASDAASSVPHGPHSTADGWTPLYLSTIAGMSTCLGAAIVFCHPRARNADGKPGYSDKRVVSADTMAFSLALAGSVMLTVSVISIGPECLMDPRFEESGGGSGGGRMMPLLSGLFLQRLISFGLGCLLYALLRMMFPEPDELEVELLTTIGRKDRETNDTVNCDGVADFNSRDVELGARPGSPRGTPSSGNLRKRSDSDLSVEMENLLRSDGENGGKGSSADGYNAKSKRGGGRGDSFNGEAALPSSTKAKSASRTPSFRSWASGEDLGTKDQRRAWRVAMLLFVSLLCHNFPEGLAVAASALESDKLGITVTIGIMIHNIPEGIAIAVPCLAARPESPWLSFLLASFSGLAEPFGAFVALGFLRGFDVKSTLEGGGDDAATEERGFLSLENVLAFVAGIMITVAVVELFPEARRHVSTTSSYLYGGTISGIVIMVLTELGT